MLKHSHDCLLHEGSRLRPPKCSNDGLPAKRPLPLVSEGKHIDAKQVGGPALRFGRPAEKAHGSRVLGAARNPGAAPSSVEGSGSRPLI